MEVAYTLNYQRVRLTCAAQKRQRGRKQEKVNLRIKCAQDEEGTLPAILLGWSTISQMQDRPQVLRSVNEK